MTKIINFVYVTINILSLFLAATNVECEPFLSFSIFLIIQFVHNILSNTAIIYITLSYFFLQRGILVDDVLEIMNVIKIGVENLRQPSVSVVGVIVQQQRILYLLNSVFITISKKFTNFTTTIFLSLSFCVCVCAIRCNFYFSI